MSWRSIEAPLHAFCHVKPILGDQPSVGLKFAWDRDILEARANVHSGHVRAVLQRVNDGMSVGQWGCRLADAGISFYVISTESVLLLCLTLLD